MVDETIRASAEKLRALLERGDVPPAAFRAALAAVPSLEQDAWLDAALGLEVPPDDGPGLPPECVPYLPCPVGAVLRALDLGVVGRGDVFVDVGAGVGRALAVAALTTSARVVGVEVQPGLVAVGRKNLDRLRLRGAQLLGGDAAALPGAARDGTVYFLYCPFSGARLAALLGELERVAHERDIRVCCVDLPLPPCGWLEPIAAPAGDLSVYRSIPAAGSSNLSR